MDFEFRVREVGSQVVEITLELYGTEAESWNALLILHQVEKPMKELERTLNQQAMHRSLTKARQ